MLTKARAVAGETYVFKKGYSRSKSSSSTDSDERATEPCAKRKKIMAGERQQEINNLEEVIKSTIDQLDIKRKRLQRAKNVNDFTLCDKLSSAITSLLVEKSDHERQLKALNRKEEKSKRYMLKKAKKNSPQSKLPQRKKDISISDMFLRKEAESKVKQSTDSQVIVVEDGKLVLERSESSSSGDTIIIEKSDGVQKQSANCQDISDRSDEDMFRNGPDSDLSPVNDTSVANL